MSCGVPVIGSDSGEIPNVIGEAGIIFPEGDSAALAQAIDRVIDGPQLAETLSRAGRTRVLDHYTQEQVALATLNIYREIVPQAEL
jgi:glycosyltransferase involved in cell wall biosynthesis